jgi:hypothetical protein|tara:strand:+ start:642 stop:1001 length:360 start_codon:yes stop_codon:yes gene_type:complete
MAIIALPWSFRIVYGFMSDNFRIFGTKRRGHILMNAGCCIVTMCSLIIFNNLGKYFITFCLIISQLNMAYNDTVTEALTVQASNKGVINASESLNTISFYFQTLGAICGALIVLISEEH